MSDSKFIPKLISTSVLACVAAGGLGLATSGTAGAASPADDVKIVLDQLCEARGGTAYTTPYSITRCQFARANKGFDAEREVCEELADGEFILSIGMTHMNRASWGCSPTSPAG